MDIDPFSMLEVSLQEPENDGGDSDCMEVEPSSESGSKKTRSKLRNDLGRAAQLHPLFNSNEISRTPQNSVMANKERLAVTTKDEERYRKRTYSSINLVLKKRLHCTVCDAHVGAHIGLKAEEIEHPLLRVLVCSRCTNKYRLMEFPLTPEGRDIRCRWCTSSSTKERPLRFCKACPFAFCEMCIYRNLPLDELANKNNWVCFVCNIQDLWPPRAMLWALRVLIDTNLAMNEERRWRTDQAICCKNSSTGAPRPRNRTITVTRPQPSGHPFKTSQQTNGHMKSIVRSIRPPPMVLQRQRFQPVQQQQRFSPTNSNGHQLFETRWLTGKIRMICNSLMTLHSNLSRLSSGIPEMENKYSIKSKLISMVSLLNISATQLQKASKDMEVDCKRLLDKNYRAAIAQLPAVQIVKKPMTDVKPKRKSIEPELSPVITMTQTIQLVPDDSEDESKPSLDTLSPEKILVKPCFVRLERLPSEERLAEQTDESKEDNRSWNKRKRRESDGGCGKKVKTDAGDDDSRTGVSDCNEGSRERVDQIRESVEDENDDAKPTEVPGVNNTERREESGETESKEDQAKEDDNESEDGPKVASSVHENRSKVTSSEGENEPDGDNVGTSNDGLDRPTEENRSLAQENPSLPAGPAENPASLANEPGDSDRIAPLSDIAAASSFESPCDSEPSEVIKTEDVDAGNPPDETEGAVQSPATSDSSPPSAVQPSDSQQSEKMKKLLQRMKNN